LDTLSKKLTKKFRNSSIVNYQITGENLCHECVERHKALDNGKIITFEDLKSSCYVHIFYETNTFYIITPILLKELINKKKLEVEPYIMESFFKKMRNKNIPIQSLYTREQRQIIIETLKYILSIYYMDSYETWDYEKEKIVYYFEEESLYTEIKQTLIFWEEHLQSKYDQ